MTATQGTYPFRWAAAYAPVALAIAGAWGCSVSALRVSDDHPASVGAASASAPDVARMLESDPTPLPPEGEDTEPSHEHHRAQPPPDAAASRQHERAGARQAQEPHPSDDVRGHPHAR